MILIHHCLNIRRPESNIFQEKAQKYAYLSIRLRIQRHSSLISPLNATKDKYEPKSHTSAKPANSDDHDGNEGSSYEWDGKRSWSATDQANLLTFILDSTDPKQEVPAILNEFSSVLDMNRLYTLIRDLGIADSPEKSFHVFLWMNTTTQFLPNARAYQCLIAVMAEHGQLAVAKRLYSHMIKSGIEPTQFTKQALALAYAKKNQTANALDLISTMEKDSSRASVHVSLLSFASRIGQPRLVKELFVEFYKEFGHQVVPVQPGAVQEGQGRGGRSAVRENPSPGLNFEEKEYLHFPPGTLQSKDYNRLITALKRVGLNREVEKVVDALLLVGGEQEMMSVRNWNTAMAAFLRAGALEDALKLYRRMRGSRVEPDAISFSIVFRIYLQGGNTEEALGLLRELSVSGRRATLEHYNSVLSLLSREGRAGKCREVLRGMEMAGVPPNVDSYNSLIRAYKEAGQMMEAVKASRVVCAPQSVVKANQDTRWLLLEVYAVEKMFSELREELQALKAMGAPLPKSLMDSLLQLYSDEGRSTEFREATVGMQVAKQSSV